MTALTELKIQEEFEKLLEEKFLDKITVVEIADRCEMNRNTFYYHYDNIEALVDAYFTRRQAEFAEKVSGEETLYDTCAALAMQLFRQRKKLLHLNDDRSRSVLRSSVEEVARMVIERFVRQSAEPYGLNARGIGYILDFYSYVCAGALLLWIDHGMASPPRGFLKKMCETYDATIDSMIRDYMEREMEES